MYIGEELSSLVGFLEWVASNSGVCEGFVLLVLFFLAAYILPVYFVVLFSLLIYQKKKKRNRKTARLPLFIKARCLIQQPSIRHQTAVRDSLQSVLSGSFHHSSAINIIIIRNQTNFEVCQNLPLLKNTTHISP